MKSYAASNVHVPHAVVDRAALHDMIYAACPRCLTSLAAALQQLPLDRIGVSCPSCGTAVKSDAVPYKYRLKLTLLMDGTHVRDAMLFDEPAQALLGVAATQLRPLLHQYPTLPTLLEELLLGLHVAFTYQPAATRAGSSKYQRDLKVLTIQPLAPELLPKPLVPLAMDWLPQDHSRRRRRDAAAPSTVADNESEDDGDERADETKRASV